MDNRHAFVADLGLDKVLVYRFDAGSGELSPRPSKNVTLEPGSGPRHFAFHPTGQYAYVINELASTVSAMQYRAETGELKTLQTVSTLPEDFAGNSTTAEIRVHPSGKFVYGSNRGHDSIAVMTVDAQSGKLNVVQYQSTLGRTPRNFAVDPTGKYVVAANQNSSNVSVFAIDPEAGTLQPVGRTIDVPLPVCVRFMKPPLNQVQR